jgi:hypothetical protein
MADSALHIVLDSLGANQSAAESSTQFLLDALRDDSVIVNFVIAPDSRRDQTSQASPRSGSPAQQRSIVMADRSASWRSARSTSPVGSPRRATVLERIMSERKAAADRVRPGGKFIALRFLFANATADFFERRADGEAATVTYGLRCMRSAVETRLNVPGSSQTQPSVAAAASAAAWQAAMSGFAEMRAKAGSAAQLHPALTFTAIVAPIAFSTTTKPFPTTATIGLQTLWTAASERCAAGRRALKRQALLKRREAETEARQGPVEVKFHVHAPLSLPTAPYASVPWLELLVEAMGPEPTMTADEKAARASLLQVVQSATRSQAAKKNVEALRDLFDLTTHRQEFEKDQTALSPRESAGFASHSAQRAMAWEQRRMQHRLARSADTSTANASLVATSNAGGADASNGSLPVVALPHRLITPESRLEALRMLIHLEDPPLHVEPFCAAPATLKAMAMKKAVAEGARPELTPTEKAEQSAARAAQSASSTRLASILRGLDRELPPLRTQQKVSEAKAVAKALAPVPSAKSTRKR